MSDTDSLDFLQTGFDPAGLTVPRLRSILVNYNVSYPSTAKKSQLVNIFIEEILPQKSRILKELDLARRSSRGIVNAASPEILEAESDIAPISRISRRNTRKTITREEIKEETEGGINQKKKKTQSPTKKTPRVSSKHARSSDTEAGIDLDNRRKSLRKRKSEIPAHYQPELANVKQYVLSDLPSMEKMRPRESAFSYDNPFQSGSSPPSGKKPEMGRNSLSISRERRRTSGYTRLQRETSRTFDKAHPPSSKTFEYPATPTCLKAINVIKDLDEDVIEPGEEFTPEEQVELAIERDKKGAEVFHPSNHKPKSTNILNLKAPFWIMTFTMLICYFAWYREEKIAVGYCGIGREAIPLISSTWDLPNWARILVEPECEPCPHHAFCYDRLEMDCERDFLRKPHPLSLGRLFPLPPTCEPDGKKVRKARIVADRAVEELRELRVKYECGASNNEAGNLKLTADIDADDLKHEVSKKRQKVISEAEFEDLWTASLDEIKSRDEVQSVVDGSYNPSGPILGSQAPHSLDSLYLALSDDPYAKRWQNIATKLVA